MEMTYSTKDYSDEEVLSDGWEKRRGFAGKGPPPDAGRADRLRQNSNHGLAEVVRGWYSADECYHRTEVGMPCPPGAATTTSELTQRTALG